MARKSAKQRLSEIIALRKEYRENKSSELFYSWDVRFLDAMISRMEIGKVLSKNMRTKIDLLVEEGLKLPPDCKEAEETQKFRPDVLRIKRSLARLPL